MVETQSDPADLNRFHSPSCNYLSYLSPDNYQDHYHPSEPSNTIDVTFGHGNGWACYGAEKKQVNASIDIPGAPVSTGVHVKTRRIEDVSVPIERRDFHWLAMQSVAFSDECKEYSQYGACGDPLALAEATFDAELTADFEWNLPYNLFSLDAIKVSTRNYGNPTVGVFENGEQGEVGKCQDYRLNPMQSRTTPGGEQFYANLAHPVAMSVQGGQGILQKIYADRNPVVLFQQGDLDLTIRSTVIGHGKPQINVGLFRNPFSVSKPEGREDDIYRPFLVATRDGEGGSIVPEEAYTGNLVELEARWCGSGPYPEQVTWEVNGQNITMENDEVETGDPTIVTYTDGQRASYRGEVLLQGERQTDGRDQEPIELEIEARVDESGFPPLEETKTLRQVEGRRFGIDFFNVIRQEYEDVTSDEGADGRIDSDEILSANSFSDQQVDLPHAQDNSTAPAPSHRDPHFDWYALNGDIIPGMEEAYEWAVNDQGFNVNTETSRESFYWITTHYRSPTRNEQAGGVGNSEHIKGNAVDFFVRSSNDLGGRLGSLVQDWTRLSTYSHFRGINSSIRAFGQMIQDHGRADRCIYGPDYDDQSDTKRWAHCEWQ